ncbi:F-box protein At4g00893-like isoform X2 [Diospyros lotus]|uniref:F-box protein At4g00893-like isoform X2 n=1 Tax=Diospyros lotus TaxID=55363 RepID=UPI00225AD8F3|nr:F-box protein At4g00893-like isoform X2 [Diospyros lotus]
MAHAPNPRSRIVTRSCTSKAAVRPWSDLPPELLSPIADRLGLIELLGFRGSCKSWQSASSTATAEIESSPDQNPWFILYGEDSKCILYSESAKKKYTINIPELDGATCLASSHGWLLLYCKQSIFFFCPFSRAKIELPEFPHSDLSNHVGVFSAPPTSENCVVCVINRQDDRIVELNMLCRGAEAWTKDEHVCAFDCLENISSATYHEGNFYFLDNANKMLTYSVNKKKWTRYRIIENRKDTSPDADYLPFGYKRSYFRNCCLKNCLDLEDNVSVSTCGTTIPGHDWAVVLNNEKIEAEKENETRQLKGVWIHPRFLQVPPNLSWAKPK